MFKGAWAVDRARSELQRMGFQVELPNCPSESGPDLELIYNFVEPVRVEVKLATLSKCGRGHAWRVNRVCKDRLGDDLIAIVFPIGHVIIGALSDHRKLCNKSGDRYLRDLGRIFS